MNGSNEDENIYNQIRLYKCEMNKTETFQFKRVYSIYTFTK
ncbi:unnamed protein product [Larinioides sclopetarius]|uniref:Uncharacterized protein n=1 Tax=Larinioides sclopetarius TaxID=280406 RepID=A0AAV2BFF3_9ARAC